MLIMISKRSKNYNSSELLMCYFSHKDTSFKHEIQEFYHFYAENLNKIKSKLKLLFTSDEELQTNLYETFDLEKLNTLIEKLKHLIEEIQIGTYEIINFGEAFETRLRIQEVTYDIVEMLNSNLEKGDLGLAIKRGSFILKYKFSFLFTVVFGLYFFILIRRKLNEQGKKLV